MCVRYHTPGSDKNCSHYTYRSCRNWLGNHDRDRDPPQRPHCTPAPPELESARLDQPPRRKVFRLLRDGSVARSQLVSSRVSSLFESRTWAYVSLLTWCWARTRNRKPPEPSRRLQHHCDPHLKVVDAEVQAIKALLYRPFSVHHELREKDWGIAN